MPRIILDPTTSARIKHAADPVEFCDDSGQSLGFLTTAARRAPYSGPECPLSAEEIALRLKETEGRTYSTSEVLDHLKGLGGS